MMPKSSASPDISVIITAHAEGRLAHRSVRSAQRAIRCAEIDGAKVEMIAVLDSPSVETLSYFEEQEECFSAIARIDMLAPGSSRNHGARIAAGRYLAFLDAGDLFSGNWLAFAFCLAAALQDERIILHPEFNLYFGDQLLLSASINSDSADYSPLELMQFNPWTSQSFVARSFFLDGNQYATTKGNAFCCDDWWWNSETIANGATHRLVPETVHFIRLRNQNQKQKRLETFGPSKLFEKFSTPGPSVAAGDESGLNARIKNNVDVPPGQAAGPRGLMRRTAISLIRPHPNLMQLVLEVNSALKNFRVAPPASTSTFNCNWLIEEWRQIHKIEPELFPTLDVLENLDQRSVPKSLIARYYPELEELFGDSPTHVFLVPWVKRGGADIVAINFMKAILEQERDSKVVCLTTENKDSEWLSKLPEKVRLVEFGKILSAFPVQAQAMLLHRLLIQKKPRVIHNINSWLGYRLFTEGGATLVAQSSLFASLFGVEFLPEGNIGGYAYWDLANCIDHLSGVLTDSRWFIDRLCDTYGFDRTKFSVVYVPSPNPVERPLSYRGDRVLNILWASRMDRGKRLDVLFQVATRLVGLPYHFHVYGAEVDDPPIRELLRALSNLPNVTTYGPYDGFQSLVVDNYDVFLYTSERDGVPNVLLEAMAAGLPVVAPDVGGIREIVSDATGFLVTGADGVDEYVRYLMEIQRNYQVVAPRIKSAQSLVASRHSWSSFVRTVEQLPLYLLNGHSDTASQ
jgi:glycosyltransferase involved in cell wall biosynthesis